MYYGQLVLQCKVDAIKGYGGIITPCAPTMEARESTAAEVEQRTGAAFIPPYNYGPTICGQGTIALEFLQQASHFVCSAGHPDKALFKIPSKIVLLPFGQSATSVAACGALQACRG